MSEATDSIRRHLVSWSINFLNLIVFIFSFGNAILTEGRYFSFLNLWTNWNLYYFCEPKNFFRPDPTQEKELCEKIRKAKRVRVVAGGHSFNSATLSDDLLINLDNYNKVLQFDTDRGVIVVQVGIRMRDFFHIAEQNGWDLPVLGTANAQSLGGLIASDLHATGNENGFLSEQLIALRIIDSDGNVKVFKRGDDEFHCAIGGIGALGVVVEAEVQLVQSFLVKRVTNYVNRAEAEEALPKLLKKHDHVGFFYIGGLNADRIRLTTYDKAKEYESITPFYHLKNSIAQIFDLLNGGFFIDIARFFPNAVLKTGYFVWNNSFLGQPFVYHAGDTFTTRLFFRHDEMEYGMPLVNFDKAIKSLVDYLDNHGIVALMEVRFTLGNSRSRALLGPGSHRDTVFIEILPTLTNDTKSIFNKTEHIFVENQGRPHLGKHTSYNLGDMEREFGKDVMDKFNEARRRQDKEDKFVNDFVAQVFIKH